MKVNRKLNKYFYNFSIIERSKNFSSFEFEKLRYESYNEVVLYFFESKKIFNCDNITFYLPKKRLLFSRKKEKNDKIFDYLMNIIERIKYNYEKMFLNEIFNFNLFFNIRKIFRNILFEIRLYFI